MNSSPTSLVHELLHALRADQAVDAFDVHGLLRQGTLVQINQN